jgi:DNA-binding beta-propeller fold protein YncE
MSATSSRKEPYSYVIDRDWMKLPEEMELGIIGGVAVDSEDNVYLFHRGKGPIASFSSDGAFLNAFGDDDIEDPHGISVGADDVLYVVDRDGHQIFRYSQGGEILLRLGSRGQASFEAPFNHPTDAFEGSGGEIYVSDGYGNSRVHKFSSDGAHLMSWGRSGTGPGEFSVPHGICVDTQGRVYVADRDNHRVQIFTGDGQYLSEWNGYYRPTDVQIDRNGAVYVSDLAGRISVYDQDGNLLGRVRVGQTGKGDRAHGVCVNSKGIVYVALASTDVVEKYIPRN